ncbi:xanthine dehydrogenase family protein molybdopterin-binding subunit [Sesbania bispinosa]|nr:xanthine dehydrogenase family protein molybdopterin-binding subunit [Sesbania bispinosa]
MLHFCEGWRRHNKVLGLLMVRPRWILQLKSAFKLTQSRESLMVSCITLGTCPHDIGDRPNVTSLTKELRAPSHKGEVGPLWIGSVKKMCVDYNTRVTKRGGWSRSTTKGRKRRRCQPWSYTLLPWKRWYAKCSKNISRLLYYN